MKAWLGTWLLLAAVAWPVGMLMLTVHEAIGHGLVAEMTGGRFLSFYLSPAPGFAEFRASPGAGRLIVLGIAAPLTAGIGILAWARTRRSARFLPRVAGWYGLLAAIDSLGSWGLLPWIAPRAGGAGDWGTIWRACGVRPFIPGLLALGSLALLSALALADAQRILTVHHPAPGRRDLTGSYWLMVSASAVPGFAYLLALWPYWRPVDLSLPATPLILPTTAWLTGLVAMPIVRRLGWAQAGDAEAAGTGLRMPGPPAALAWAAALLMTTLGVASLFGPATRLRTGLAIRALTPDDYFELDSRMEVDWAFEGDGSGRLTVRSSPPAHSDSAFEERRFHEADRLGPSAIACDRMLREVAAPIEGVALGAAAGAPDRSQGAWRCVLEARATGRGLEFVVPERAAAMSVSAPGLASRRYSARGVPLALSSGAARWVRPERIRGTDALRVRF